MLQSLQKLCSLPSSSSSSSMFRACSSVAQHNTNFRDEFTFPDGFDFRVWYPKHMSLQFKKMEGKMRSIDLILEVHDARIPLTGRNPLFFEKLYAVRPHILVLNKMDLINLKKYKEPIERYYEDHGIKRVVWTDCKRRLSRALGELQEAIILALRSEPRFNRTVKTEYQIMVVGIPNVGKSSVINSLRSLSMGVKHSAVREGARPGVTIRVQNRVRILDKPPTYILDTPGVLTPRQEAGEDAMKLALCDLSLDTTTDQRVVADYLLFWLNRSADFSYVRLLSLPRPYDNIDQLCLELCKANNWTVRRMIGGSYEDRWDFDCAYKTMINLFRSQKLRDHCLDEALLRKYML